MSSRVLGRVEKDEVGDGQALAEGKAELPVQGVVEEDEVLLGERQVEAEVVEDLLALGVGEGRVDIGQRGVTRQEAEQQEQDGGDRPEDEQHVGEAFQGEGHAWRSGRAAGLSFRAGAPSPRPSPRGRGSRKR